MVPRGGYFLGYEPARGHDLAQLLPNFETPIQTETYRAQRTAILRTNDPDQRQLADKLDACGGEDGRCLSPACPDCCRAFRRWIYSEAAYLLEERTDLWAMTLIMPETRAPVGELHTIDPTAAVNCVRTQLRRANLPPLVLIGGVDLSLEIDRRFAAEKRRERPPAWKLHVHMVGSGCPSAAVRKALKPHYPPTKAVPLPIKVHQVRNLPTQLSYCFKFHHQRRVSYHHPLGSPRTHKHLLHSEEMREDCQFLDSHSFAELTFLKGVRRVGKQLKIV